MLLLLCCCLLIGGALAAFIAKPQKPRKPAQTRTPREMPPMPPPLPEPVPEQQAPPVQEYVEPPPVQEYAGGGEAPLATESTPIPAYSTVYAAPVYEAYSEPMYAAPVTTAYATPQTVAMPMASPYPTSYQQQYAAAPAFPSTTSSYATVTPYGGSTYMGGAQAYPAQAYSAGGYGGYTQ